MSGSDPEELTEERRDAVEDILEKRRRKWEEEKTRAGAPQASSPVPSETVELTDANFDATLAGYGLMLVDFWAPWCGPCKWVTPILEEIVKENPGRLGLAKMNVDENPRTSFKFGIRGIPTIMICKNGKILDAIVGAVPKNVLVAKIEHHMDGKAGV